MPCRQYNLVVAVIVQSGVRSSSKSKLLSSAAGTAMAIAVPVAAAVVDAEMATKPAMAGAMIQLRRHRLSQSNFASNAGTAREFRATGMSRGCFGLGKNPSVIGCANATSPFVLRKNGEDQKRLHHSGKVRRIFPKGINGEMARRRRVGGVPSSKPAPRSRPRSFPPYRSR